MNNLLIKIVFTTWKEGLFGVLCSLVIGIPLGIILNIPLSLLIFIQIIASSYAFMSFFCLSAELLMKTNKDNDKIKLWGEDSNLPV